MNNKVSGLVALVAFVVAGFTYFTVPEEVTNEKVTERVIEREIGAVSGPDFQGPNGCFSFSGVRKCYVTQSWQTGTSTPCVIRNPVGAATSSILGVYISANAPTTTAATQYTLATSTGSYATTTVLMDITRSAGLVSTMSYVPTNNIFLNTNDRIVLGLEVEDDSDAALTNSIATGVCTAEFLVTR